MKLSLSKLLEAGASRSYYATDSQKHYIEILSREAFSKGFRTPFPIDARTLNDLPFEDAKKWLDVVLSAKRAGWPDPEPEPDMSQTHFNIIRPDGKPGTILKRVWENSKENLLKKGYKLA